MEEKRSFATAISGMFKGIVRPYEYVENGRRSSWFSAFWVILIISIVVPFLTFFMPVNNLYGNGKLADKIDEKLPDFVFNEQGFSCIGQSTWSDDSGLYFSIDTRVNMVSDDMVQDIIESGNYNTIVCVARKNIFLYSVDYNGGKAIYKDWSEIYDTFNDQGISADISKEQIVNAVKKLDTPVIITIYIILVIFTFIAYYICILFWGMLGVIFNSMKRVGLSYGDLCKMAVYIRAPWYIIKKLFNRYVYYNGDRVLWILMFIIIALYVYAAVNSLAKKMKDDLDREVRMRRINEYHANNSQN